MAKVKVVEIRGDNSDAVEKIEEVNEGLDKTKKKTKEAASLTDAFGGKVGQVADGFKKLSTRVKQGARAMGTLKGAIAATGIGLLVVAFGSLLSFFTRTERGAVKLKAATAALGAVFGVIADAAALLGETLFSALSGNQEAIDKITNSFKAFGRFIKDQLIDRVVNAVLQKFGEFQLLINAIRIGINDFLGDEEEANELREDSIKIQERLNKLNEEQEERNDRLSESYDTLKESVNDYIDEMKEEGAAAFNLTEQLENLKIQERELNVERAKSRAEIAALKLAAEDLNKSAEERIEAARAAFALEQANQQAALDNLDAQINATKALQALGENNAEANEELAALEERRAGLAEQSLGLQTELNNKINTIKNEQIALEKSFQNQLRDLRQENNLTAIEDEQEKAEAEIEIERQKALEELELTKFTEEQKAQIRAEINERAELNVAKIRTEAQEKSAAQQLELEKKLGESRLQLAQNVAGGLSSLAKEGSETARSLAIFETLVNTFAAAQAAFKSATAVGGLPAGVIAAAAATAQGLARVKAIKSQQLGSTGGGANIGGNVNFNRFTPNARTPQNVNVVNQRQQDPVRAFVLTSDVNDNQALANRLRNKTVL